VIASSFGYAGQKCSACSRVIVLESVYDQFVRRLTQAAASLVVGDPADPAVRVGPVITEGAMSRILSSIEKGKEESRLVVPLPGVPPAIRMAAVTCAESTAAAAADSEPETAIDEASTANDGTATDSAAATTPEAAAHHGSPAAPSGHFVTPHVFVDVPPTSAIAQEEIFGPVLAVFKARKFGEALELALAVQYGLTGGLYSRNPGHIRRAVREFRVGNLYINRPITGAMVGRQPFGGSRMSGVGSKAGGPDYLLQFMEPRTVTENTVRRGFAPRPEDQY
jgi:RHH-type proline utilization regulon transcriptional repressor/proline dehydrogenase/delta 1-pyrroline-5-carboxylate dehydrogenase